MTIKLWQLSEEIIDLENKINNILEDENLSDDNKEIRTQELFNKWLEEGENFKEKAEKVANFIKHQEALTKARKEECKRIQDLAKQSESKAQKMRKYLTLQMKKTNNTKIEGVKNKISIRKKPPELQIYDDFSKLPQKFIEIEYKPKRKEIKEYLKGLKENTDYECEWASLIDNNEYSLTIK